MNNNFIEVSNEFRSAVLIEDTVNEQTNIAIELKLLRIPKNEVDQLVIYTVEELNSGLPRTNPDSGRVEDLN